VQVLQQNKNYHFRILNNTNYIFFGDIDNYDGGIENVSSLLRTFLKKYYDLTFTDTEFKNYSRVQIYL
jgi:hypothetical protein